MIYKEFRVPLPMTVEEYKIGQLWAVAEACKNETGGGEGIEVVKNEPFTNYPMLGGKYSEGQYTHKIYHLQSKVPAYIRLLAPKGSLEIHETAWNAYPYSRTVLTNPGYMKDDFLICIESLHIDDTGEQDNVHELSAEKLKNREVVFIDIANDKIPSSDYKLEWDPTKFKSKKTGRGPLSGSKWWLREKPVMTCYKLVTAEFKWFGLQGKVESFIMKSEHRLFTSFHRQVFCWIDNWHGMTMDDIRAVEDKTKEDLDKLRKEGKARGMTAEDD